MKLDIKQKLLCLGAGLGILAGIAGTSKAECTKNIFFAQKSEYRADAGFSAVKGPITEGSVGVSCGNFDASIWSAYNDEAWRMNEVDIDVGYSGKIGHNLSGRIGLARWEFTEDGGKNDAAIASASYTGLPVGLSLKATKLLDADGLELKATAFKDFPLGKVGEASISLRPEVRAVCLDDFFGVTNCPSGIVGGLSLNMRKGNVDTGVKIEYHDGKGQFDNATIFGLNIGYSF